jgi:hypothetical protein
MPASAAKVLVDFETLSGSGVLQDGYGGVRWNNDFSYADEVPPLYNATSGLKVAFNNYVKSVPGTRADVSFNFEAPVMFEGAWFSGRQSELEFQFLKGGQLLATSTLGINENPTQLVGPNIGIDQVVISGISGFWVMDDLAFDTQLASAVPEPASWAMMISGFGMIGVAMRSARRRKTISLAAA